MKRSFEIKDFHQLCQEVVCTTVTEEANVFKVASDWLYHRRSVSASRWPRNFEKRALPTRFIITCDQAFFFFMFFFQGRKGIIGRGHDLRLDLLASKVQPYYLAAGWLPIFQYTVESRVVLFPALNIS